MTSRPKWLAYRAKDGIYETHFANGNTCRAELLDFVGRALEWASASDEYPDRGNGGGPQPNDARNEYRILDTFLSDSVTISELVRLFAGARRSRAPVKILLVDPTCEFALARAASIQFPRPQKSPIEEVEEGLRIILDALQDVHELRLPMNSSQCTFEDLIATIREHGESHDIELRLYTQVPGGPLMFFRDILLCGRYGVGTSSIALPWNMIIDDGYRADDVYDLLWNEYDFLWTQSEASGSAKYRIFLSHAKENAPLAGELDNSLRDNDIEVFLAEHAIGAGEEWNDRLRAELVACSELLLLASPASVKSSWVQVEVGAMWALNKPVTPVLVGVTPADLEHLPILPSRQAMDGTTTRGREQVVAALLDRAARGSRVRTLR